MKKNTTLFILILSCIFTIILLSIYLFNGTLYNVIKISESFENQSSDIVIHSCPSFLKQFSDKNGDVLCCKGDINGHRCSGSIICSVSATSSNIPSCKIYRTQYLEQQGVKFCPKSMPNYYEHTQSKIKGCTYGSVNATGEAPASISQKSCTIYDKIEDALKDKNSCLLQIKLDTMYTPTTVTDKQLVNMGNIYLPFAIYMDDMKMPRQCVDINSMKKYGDILIKDAKTNKEKVDIENRFNALINDKNAMICENAQKIFIDKTVSKADAMF